MEKTALLVMEMQNDYLWEKRKEKFTYDTNTLLTAVNAAITRAAAAGQDVLYIAQIFPDTPTNHLAMGFCIEQTAGAKLHPDLQIVSEYYFEKNTADLFTDADFRAFAEEKGYTVLQFCGLDECGGIAGTAKAAAAAGLTAEILQAACATRFDTRQKGKTRMQLKAAGVRYV